MPDVSNSLCAIYAITPDMTGKRPDYFFRFTQQATGNTLCGQDWKFFMNARSDKINQQWILERHDDTYYRILDIISGLAVTAGNNGLSLSGDPVNDSQLWSFPPVENTGRFYIMSKLPSPDGGGQWVIDGNGTDLYLHNINGGAFQCWSPAALPVNYCRINLLNSSKVLSYNGENPWLADINTGDDNQLWRFDLLDDGYYRIVHKVSGYVLDGNGTSVYINGWNAGDYQRWNWALWNANGMFKKVLTQKAPTNACLSAAHDSANYAAYTMGMIGYAQVFQQSGPQYNSPLIEWILQPNQQTLYLPKSLPYNQVSTAMAHDSHTAVKVYYDSDDVRQNIDQTQPIDMQLLGGIRTVRISCGTYKDPNVVILQHGDPNKWGDMCVFGTLNDYLQKVKTFLDNNPNEVITIIDEGDPSEYVTHFTDIYYNTKDPRVPVDEEYVKKLTSDCIVQFTKLVIDVYEGVFGDMLFARNDWTELENVKNGQWQSLSDLASEGQRVIVLMPNLSGDSLPPENNFSPNPDQRKQAKWLLPAYYPGGLISMNDYSANQPDGDETKNLRPIEEGTYFYSNRSSNPIDPKTLYLLNQQYIHTEDKAFGLTESWRAFSVWTVGDLLVENTIRAWQLTGRKPNMINVDFYQGVKGAKSTLIDLVNTLNQCESYDQVIERWAGSVLTIQDYRTRDIPGIQTLKIGGVYNIISAKSQNMYVTAGNAGDPLTLQYANGSAKQQWKLVYNSPSYGIALINQDSGLYLFDDKEGDGSVAFGAPYAPYNGVDATGWQIAYNPDNSYFWIRRSDNENHHLEVIGDDCNPGDQLQLHGWNHGLNQHFIFRPVTD